MNILLMFYKMFTNKKVGLKFFDFRGIKQEVVSKEIFKNDLLTNCPVGTPLEKVEFLFFTLLRQTPIKTLNV